MQILFDYCHALHGQCMVMVNRYMVNVRSKYVKFYLNLIFLHKMGIESMQFVTARLMVVFALRGLELLKIE